MQKRAHPVDYIIYAPVMDWWVAGITLIVIALLSASIPIILHASMGAIQSIFGIVGIVLFIAYIADTMFFTYYLLDGEGLTIVSQIRHFSIPYREMREIRPIGFRALITNKKRKRFAFSTKAVELKIQNTHWPAITLSPHNREQFLDYLLEHIDNERSSRATIERKKK